MSPPGPARALRAAAPGERWVVRCRLRDGSATDVTGWVTRVDVAAVRLAGPVDARRPEVPPDVWEVPFAAVVLARRAPDARGGPDPRRTSAAALEHLAAEAWAVALEPLGDWLLRSAGGFTGRANSCLAVGDPGVPVPQAAAEVEAYAARHGIAPMAQVVTSSEEDAALRGLGWVETYVATDVLAVRLADLLAGSAPDPRVRVAEELTPAWRAAFGEYRRSNADPAVVAALLDGRRPRAFASVEVDGTLAVIARGHLADGWLGVSGVWTRPDLRRRGLGTAVVRALARWAARRDARRCYLQVETANLAAHAAYARLGFAPHHRYHYLAPPDGDASPPRSDKPLTNDD